MSYKYITSSLYLLVVSIIHYLYGVFNNMPNMFVLQEMLLLVGSIRHKREICLSYLKDNKSQT